MVDVIRSPHLTEVRTAQKPEFIALTRACPSANICTGNHYAFGVAQNFGMLWKQQVFLTYLGQPIKNGKQIVKLLDTI